MRQADIIEYEVERTQMNLDIPQRQSVSATPEDHHKRSILKSLTWRAVATFTTMAIVYAYTDELALSLGVGAIEVVSKMFLYYVHESLWSRVRWGRAQAGSTDGESTRPEPHSTSHAGAIRTRTGTG